MSFSSIIVERPLDSGGMTSTGYNSPKDLYANTQSGDNVYIKARTYDLGSNSFIWKDGVNYNAVGGKVVFASTNAIATTTDNNVAIDVQLTGEWEFTNTNGLDKRIVLQNSASKLDYQETVVIKIVSDSVTGETEITVIQNDFGGGFTRTSGATDKIVFDNGNFLSKVSMQQTATNFDGETASNIPIPSISSNEISFVMSPDKIVYLTVTQNYNNSTIVY